MIEFTKGHEEFDVVVIGLLNSKNEVIKIMIEVREKIYGMQSLDIHVFN